MAFLEVSSAKQPSSTYKFCFPCNCRLSSARTFRHNATEASFPSVSNNIFLISTCCLDNSTANVRLSTDILFMVMYVFWKTEQPSWTLFSTSSLTGKICKIHIPANNLFRVPRFSSWFYHFCFIFYHCYHQPVTHSEACTAHFRYLMQQHLSPQNQNGLVSRGCLQITMDFLASNHRSFTSLVLETGSLWWFPTLRSWRGHTSPGASQLWGCGASWLCPFTQLPPVFFWPFLLLSVNLPASFLGTHSWCIRGLSRPSNSILLSRSSWITSGKTFPRVG